MPGAHFFAHLFKELGHFFGDYVQAGDFVRLYEDSEIRNFTETSV